MIDHPAPRIPIGGKRGRLRFKEEDLAAYIESTLVRIEDVDQPEDRP